MLERLFNAAWYGRIPWTWVLWPLLLLVLFVTKRKRQQYLALNSKPYDVPVIVVGNITLGGTGKTPVVQALVRYLQSQGYTPGVISRGYGGELTDFPHLIQNQDSSQKVGDEPFMLFQSLRIPVVVDPVRARAVPLILEKGVDVIISDDGLQHYGLHRDYEVCVIDGSRGLGNAQLMPVGPLREHRSRLQTVNYILSSDKNVDDNTFQIKPIAWVNLVTNEEQSLASFKSTDDALAIAGIGNPNKFLNTINELGIYCDHKWFPDHYDYKEQDLSGLTQQILMTEKDAVKIKQFAKSDMWYLKIAADLPAAFLHDLNIKLEQWKRDHG
ncbi:tetraacyldisaccharide 4'-kinase [Bermanella sp. WJH001]|uniref:tetraacyldisaccharide 4'-kinase n=1 Tax=Bermanella sp. WJH001 TaxID=3048005 RepID=UPI0024BDB89D|nr:tetraacyldisaccharide 4'-kinase [Bermanella sp. WJH001]MDJ1537184.1 tetraacyldisaccharide 4'-kinase [Bermanella sp. WJH001]